MKMMLWKELRENFKWAVLALLALTMAEFYILSSQRANFLGGYENEITLCSSSFLLVTSFGSAVIGAFFGAVQILPELRRDRWAALLHRPVSRGMIFFGKVCAGLMLYFFVTTSAFLVSACYVAMPGEFPVPVVPGMLVPGLSDVLIGVVFYFAAMLLCLHGGRWIGTRGMILLSAVLVFLLHLAAGGVAVAYLPLGAALVFLLGAWGAMLGHGPVASRPWPGRIAYVLIVLVGVQMVFVGIEVAIELIQWALGSPAPVVTFTQFEVTQDGQIFRHTSKSHGGTPVVTDMNGKVITDEHYVGNNTYQNFYQFVPIGFDLRLVLRGYATANLSPRNPAKYLQQLQPSNDKELWYLLTSQNYFVGYDKLSRRRIGLWDQEGFKPPGAQPKPFDQPLKGSVLSGGKPTLFWSGSRLYAFDFPERKMSPFFNAANDTIYVTANFGNSFRQDTPAHVAVALGKEIRIFDDKGAPILTFPYLHDPVRWGSVSITANKAFDRIYLQSSAGSDVADGESPPSFLDEIDLHGNVLHTYSHPYANPNASVAQSHLVDEVFSSLLPFGPTLVCDLYSRLFPDVPAYSGDEISVQSIHVTFRDLGILFIIGLAFAIISFYWARHAGIPESRAWRWAIFVFFFGPVGLMTFRLATDWPVRVCCPQCGGKRPVESEECPSCHQPWPPPPATGTEILELEKAGI